MSHFRLASFLSGVMACAGSAHFASAAPLIHYTFDEAASGTTPAVDVGAAPANDGTFGGLATRTANTPNGYSVGALDLTASGTDAYVTAGDANEVDGLTKLTLTAWVNLQGVPAHGNRIMAKQNNNATFNGFSFAFNNPTDGAANRRADNVALNLALGGSAFAFNTSDANLNADNRWIFVAATYDGTQSADNVRFYWGDANTPVQPLGGPRSANVGTLVDHAQPFRVGASSTATSSAPVWIDDARVYGDVISDLDAIRLNNVPEPASFGLLGAAGLLLARRTKR